MRVGFKLILTLVLIGCSRNTAKIEIPSEVPQLPSYVSQIDILKITESSDLLCTTMDLQNLWEDGNDPEELSNHIVQNTTVTFDHRNSYSFRDGLQFLIYSMLYPVFDSKNEVIGYYGGPIEICIELESILDGNHVLHFELTSLSSKPYEFVIYFRKNGEQSTILSS